MNKKQKLVLFSGEKLNKNKSSICAAIEPKKGMRYQAQQTKKEGKRPGRAHKATAVVQRAHP